MILSEPQLFFCFTQLPPSSCVFPDTQWFSGGSWSTKIMIAAVFVIWKGHSGDSDQIPRRSTPTQPVEENWFGFSKKAMKISWVITVFIQSRENDLFLSNRRIKGKWWHSCIFSFSPPLLLQDVFFSPPSSLWDKTVHYSRVSSLKALTIKSSNEYVFWSMFWVDVDLEPHNLAKNM